MCAKHAHNAAKLGHRYPGLIRLWEYVCENDNDAAKTRDENLAIEKMEKEKLNQKKQLHQQREKELRKSVVYAIASKPNDKKNKPDSRKKAPTTLTSQNKNGVTRWHKKKDTAKKERLDKYREKNAQEKLGYSIEKNESKSTEQSIYLEAMFDNPNLTTAQKSNLELSNLCAATGSATAAGALNFAQAMLGVFKSDARDAAHIAKFTQEMLIAMNPADIQEGMLCSRLVALHDQSMHFMSRVVNPDQTSQGIDLNINRATKLMRIYNDTLKALNRYRRKGEQRMTVQHVNINSGGQAVVTGEFKQGGDNGKK